MRSNQGGFTLVELVVVIVILGILAATAFPRFINLTSDARVAAASGMAGGLRSAVTLVQARFQATGNFAAGGTPVTMADGATVAVSTGAAGGFPTAALAGIGNAMRCESASACNGFNWNVGTNGVATFTQIGAPAACNVTYDPATGTVVNNATTGNC
jgi:MSHA pilin protein MshA